MVLEFLLPTIWLLFVSFSFGFILTKEKNLMSIGFGLAVFSVLSVVFNILHIPLNWLVFLGAALLAFVWAVSRKDFELKMPKKPDILLIIVLIMALINIYVYWVGATSYPWLEDDDPWIHATGIEWVTQTGSYSRYFDGTDFTRLFIEPYPPVYDVLMGELHQMTSSLSDTVKFFNAFLIGIGLILAFYCFEAMTGNRKLAVIGTFFLLMLPSFMGHFIWAQTLAILLLITAFYACEKSLKDNRFIIPAGIAIGALSLSEPSAAVVFLPMIAIYYIVKFYQEGRQLLKPAITIGVIAVLICVLFYGSMILKYGVDYTSKGIGIGYFTGLFNPNSTEDTSGGVIYSFNDYFIVQSNSKIDQEIGIGSVIVLLCLLGVILSLRDIASGKPQSWMLVSIIWLVFCFLGTEGNAMPVKFFPHRFWVYLSIPVAILAAHAYLAIEDRFSKHKTALLIILVVSVFITSGVGKLSVQTATWPPGASFYSQGELDGYMQLKTILPINTLVFPLCSSDDKIIGSDMLSEPYVPAYEIFKRDAVNDSASEVYAFLKGRGYSYLTIDTSCITLLGSDKANALANEYLSSGLFSTQYSNAGFILLHLN